MKNVNVAAAIAAKNTVAVTVSPDYAAEIAKLKAENEALKASVAAKAKRAIEFKVSVKGAVSIYGLNRFPVTLYKEQVLTVLGLADELKAFISSHPELKSKAAAAAEGEDD